MGLAGLPLLPRARFLWKFLCHLGETTSGLLRRNISHEQGGRCPDDSGKVDISTGRMKRSTDRPWDTGHGGHSGCRQQFIQALSMPTQVLQGKSSALI